VAHAGITTLLRQPEEHTLSSQPALRGGDGDAGHRARRITELEGLGREIWQGIEAQEYVRRERDAWTG
jgi:hypothetical protein